MRRRWLHIILVIALLIMPVTNLLPMYNVVYAEQKSAEEICEILGVLKGEGAGLTEEYLSKKTERLQAVIITLRLAGNNYEQIAYNYEGSDNFTDADVILWKEGRNVLAYIKDNPQFGWRGNIDGSFNPKGTVTAQMLYKVLLEALGYKQDYGEGGDFKWDEVMDFAFRIGLWDLMGLNELTNRDMAIGIAEALQLQVKGQNKTLLEKLVEDGSIPREKAVAAGLMEEEAKIEYLLEVDLGTVYDNDDIKLPDTVTAIYSDGTIKEVPVFWDFNYNKLKEGYNTIVGDAEGTDIMAFATLNYVTRPLEVTSVSMDNLIQIYIKFNKAVDVDRAMYIYNYSVVQEEEEKKIVKATLSEDKTQVTLLLDAPLKAQKNVYLTVKRELGLKKNYDATIDYVIDRYEPKVLSVKALGNKIIRVVYSEPVKNATYSSNYTLDSKSIGTSGIKMVNESTVDINLSKRLESGTYKLGVRTGVVDYAGFKVMTDPIEFVVENDTNPPAIDEIMEVTQTKMVFRFNKPVEPVTKEQILAKPSGRVYSVSYEDDMQTYTVEFERTAALQPEGATISIYNVIDLYGNQKTISVNVVPDVDTDIPEYIDYEIKDQNKIILTFSEDVLPTGATYVLKNSKGEVVSLSQMGWYTDGTGRAYRNRLVLQRPGGVVFEPGKYTLSIQDVVDYTPQENRINPLTIEFTVVDNISPVVESVRVKDNKFFIRFSESVDVTTATSRSNYRYMSFKTYASEVFPEETTYEVISDGRTVAITLPDNFDMKIIDVLQISSVTDKAGNVMAAMGATAPFSTIDSPPRIISAAVTDKNTIEVTFNRDIDASTLTAEDFLITAGDEALIVLKADYNEEEKKVILQVDNLISSNGQYAGKDIYVQTAYDEPYTTDIYGQPIQKTTNPIKAADKYPPYATGFITVYNGENTDIIISLNENIRTTNGSGKPLANNDSELKQFIVLVNNTVAPIISSRYEEASSISTARIILTISGNQLDKNIRVMFFAGPDNTLTDYASTGNPLRNFELP